MATIATVGKHFVRPGDVLVVWKLDRLGRSLSHLLSIVNALKENQVAFRSLTEGVRSRSAGEATLSQQLNVRLRWMVRHFLQAVRPNVCVPRFAFDSASGKQPLPTPTR